MSMCRHSKHTREAKVQELLLLSFSFLVFIASFIDTSQKPSTCSPSFLLFTLLLEGKIVIFASKASWWTEEGRKSVRYGRREKVIVEAGVPFVYEPHWFSSIKLCMAFCSQSFVKPLWSFAATSCLVRSFANVQWDWQSTAYYSSWISITTTWQTLLQKLPESFICSLN